MSDAGKSRAEAGHDRRHLGVRALQRDSGLEPHEAVEEVIDVVLAELLAEPEVAAVRRVEVARRHAGDGRRDFREPDRLADDGRIAVIESCQTRYEMTTTGGGGPCGAAACCGGGGGGGGTKLSCMNPPSVIGSPNSSKKPS